MELYLKHKLEKIFKFIFGFFIAIGIISVSTIIGLNSTFVYRSLIERYDLVNATGVNSVELMRNYKGMIDYLQNPFIDKLSFENFNISKYGEIHFKEVKNIFFIIMIIAIIFIVFILIFLLLQGVINKNKEYILKVLGYFNIAANFLIIFFSLIIGAYFIDFSRAFEIFHSIFFKNDYWIFDTKLDSIINALPEEVFMIYGIFILSIIGISIIFIKVLSKVIINKKLDLNLNI